MSKATCNLYKKSKEELSLDGLNLEEKKHDEESEEEYPEEEYPEEEYPEDENWEEKLELTNKVKLNSNVSCALIRLDKLKFLDMWNLQRSINNDRLELLTKHYINFFDENDEIDHTDPIHIAFKTYEINKNPMFVLDGQHRVQSYIEFLKRRPTCAELKIQVIIHYVKSEKDFDHRFNLVNNRLPVDMKTLMNQKFFRLKELLNDFYCVKDLTFQRITKHKTVTKKFTNVFELTTRPYLNEGIFMVTMRSNPFCQKSTPEEIFEKIVDINNNIKKDTDNINDVDDDMKRIMKDLNFYLGCDKKMGWFDDLIGEI